MFQMTILCNQGCMNSMNSMNSMNRAFLYKYKNIFIFIKKSSVHTVYTVHNAHTVHTPLITQYGHLEHGFGSGCMSLTLFSGPNACSYCLDKPVTFILETPVVSVLMQSMMIPGRARCSEPSLCFSCGPRVVQALFRSPSFAPSVIQDPVAHRFGSKRLLGTGRLARGNI